MKLKTMNKILKYRDFLQAISQVSFSYSTLNRNTPLSSIDDYNADELLDTYRELAIKVRDLTNENEKLYKVTE